MCQNDTGLSLVAQQPVGKRLTLPGFSFFMKTVSCDLSVTGITFIKIIRVNA